MARFRFRAIDESGQIVEGVLDAANRDELVRALAAEGRKPLRAEEQTPGIWTELTRARGTSTKKLSDRDRALFIRKLATLISAGISLEDALAINTKSRKANATVALSERLLARLREGASLAQALVDERETFPEQYVAMVRAGETGGALPKILDRLADMQDRALETRDAVQSAMVYPAILVVTSTLAIATIFTFVLPAFEPLFKQANMELPLLTSIVMAMSRFVRDYGLYMIALIALAGIAVNRLLAIETLRLRWDAMLARTPLLGPFLQQSGLGQTTAVLGALIVNGVSLDSALRLVERVPVNRAFRRGLSQVRTEVIDGRRLSSAFEAWQLCPELVPQLARAGESTGNLGEMLLRASEALEQGARTSIDRGMSLLTPLLTLILGGFVGVIVFSVLLAVLSANDLAF